LNTDTKVDVGYFNFFDNSPTSVPISNIVNDDEDLDKGRNFIANIRQEKFKSMRTKRENTSNITNI